MLVNLNRRWDCCWFGQIHTGLYPAWRSEKLSPFPAQGDLISEHMYPHNMPALILNRLRHFESATWRIELKYTKGMRYLTLTFYRKTKDIEARIVDLSQPENLWPGTVSYSRAESYRMNCVKLWINPVFKAKTSRWKAVKTRAYTSMMPGWPIRVIGCTLASIWWHGGRSECKGRAARRYFNILQAVPFRWCIHLWTEICFMKSNPVHYEVECINAITKCRTSALGGLMGVVIPGLFKNFPLTVFIPKQR